MLSAKSIIFKATFKFGLIANAARRCARGSCGQSTSQGPGLAGGAAFAFEKNLVEERKPNEDQVMANVGAPYLLPQAEQEAKRYSLVAPGGGVQTAAMVVLAGA